MQGWRLQKQATTTVCVQKRAKTLTLCSVFEQSAMLADGYDAISVMGTTPVPPLCVDARSGHGER